MDKCYINALFILILIFRQSCFVLVVVIFAFLKLLHFLDNDLPFIFTILEEIDG